MIRYRDLKSKRAVSPVIAVVLLIALTVAASAIVFVIFNSLVVDAPEYIITIEQEYDHNNDGKVDHLRLKATDLSGEAHVIRYVGIPNWNVTEPVAITANGQEFVDIYTSKLGSQFEQSTKINMGLSPYPDLFSLVTLSVGIPELTAPVIVTVSTATVSPLSESSAIESTAIDSPLSESTAIDSTAIESTATGVDLSGILISFTLNDSSPVAIPPIATDANGEINVYLMPGYYVAHTSTGLSSELFFSLSNKSVTITNSLVGMVYVQVLDNTGSPITDVTVFNTDTAQNELGQTAVTNASGIATFALSYDTYLFKIDYLSQNYWSSSVKVPDSSIVQIQIKSGYLAGSINFNGVLPGKDHRLYLYTATNISLNQNMKTDTDSAFNFTSRITSGLYRLRLRTIGGQYVMSSILSTSTVNLTVNFGGGNLEIKTLAGGVPIPKNVRIYLYTAAGNYLTNRKTDINGTVDFGLIPGLKLKTRTDIQGQRIYSDPFYHDNTQTEIELGGGNLEVQITTGGVIIPRNVRVYMYTSSGSYTGLSRKTDNNGTVDFGVVLQGKYKVRIDYLGRRTYTSVFNHTEAQFKIIDLDGADLKINITIGGTPISKNVRVYLYTSTGSYTGMSTLTDASGSITYTAIFAGDYKIRVDYLGQRKYSDVFTHSNITHAIDLGGGNLEVKLTSGGIALPQNIRVYLYTSTGSYTGISTLTNSSGVADFGAIFASDYKIRVDYLGQRKYSDVFTHSGDTIENIELGGGTLNAYITIGGTPLVANVRGYLYTSSGSYTGKSGLTDANGTIDFGVIFSSDYKVRIDWLGFRSYSSSFTHSQSNVQEVPFDGSRVQINVKVGGANMPQNVRVYLYTSSGSYSGYSRLVNSTGYVDFGSILANDYKIRSDYLGKRYYSNVFTNNGSVSYDIVYSGVTTMTISVIDAGSTPLSDGQWIYLYHSDGTYTGLRAQVSSDVVVFNAIVDGDYKLRWYNISANVYTSPFTAEAAPATQQFP